MHNFKKSFGQNFLQSKEIIQKISEKILSFNKNIIEIGPGEGALTKELIKSKSDVISFEIDMELYSKLKSIENKNTNFTPIFKDFLKQDINIYKDYVLCGNIPYNLTSQIVEKFLQSDMKIAVFMVQKEVADRLSGKPKTKDYGYITCIINYYGSCQKLFDVSKNNFYPIPKVDSGVIVIEKNKFEKIDSEFDNFLKASFKNKRKTLVNNLVNNYNIPKDKINKILNNSNIRAEELSVDMLYNIYLEVRDEN